VLAASSTVDAIKATVGKKLAVWGSQLKDNAPQTLRDVVIPAAFDEKRLRVDGAVIEIVDAVGLANRRYLWVPSLKAVFGGVLIFSGVHVWTADTKGAEQRAAWRTTLDTIESRGPAVVVPGHMTPDVPTDVSAIVHTKRWLTAFEEELANAKDSAALNAAMKARFPGLGMTVAIDIGARVATGEMQWG